MPAFVELPNGLFTSQGDWFHTTVADLQAFAGPVLERVSIKRLLNDAGVWVRSHGTLALWVTLAALLVRTPGIAILLGLVAFVGWLLLAPGLVFRPVVRLSAWLQHPLLVGGAYVAGLSWMGAGDGTAAVFTGLAWFVAIRWGLIDRLMEPVVQPILKRLYRVPVADQTLRALIVRHALAYRVSVGDLDDMEKRILDIAHRHRKKE